MSDFPKGSFEDQVLSEIGFIKKSLSTCQRLHLGYEVGNNGTPGRVSALPPGWQGNAIGGGIGGGIVGAGFVLAKLMGLL